MCSRCSPTGAPTAARHPGIPPAPATEVVPDDELLDRARATASAILAKGPLAVRLAKLVVRTGMDADLRTGLVVEQLAQSLLYTTDHKREGAEAFLAKRSPAFRGR